MKKTSTLTVRRWLTYILVGFVGQLAWAIENNYFNVYAFHVTSTYIYIPIMTIASALAATLTTLFMGALSDRLGKRKIFISVGYILWGISIITFAFLDPNSTVSMVAGSAAAAGAMIVIMDCVMTFFGSTANDAAFNAFVTDNTNESNRAKVESILSVLPLIAMIFVIAVAGIFVDGAEKRWDLFFYVFGGVTLLIGVISLFMIPEDAITPNTKETYLKNVVYGFRPSVVKANPILYTTLIAFMTFSISVLVFMPYFILYVQNVLKIQGADFTTSFILVFALASIITVALGFFMDRIGKNKVMTVSIPVSALAAFAIFLIPADKGATTKAGFMIFGVLLMTGYLISVAVLGAKVRDYTPKNEVGLFQGVRMVFVVLLPMVFGPIIGQAICRIGGTPYENEYGQTVYPPNKWLFLVSAIIILLAIIPVVLMFRNEKKAQNEKANSVE